MKTIEITNNPALESVLSGSAGEDVVVLRNGQPVAMVTPFDGDDLQWYATEHDPVFTASLARARSQAARGETVSFNDVEALATDEVDGLDLIGFSSATSIETLQRTRCASVPGEPGVYVVMRPPSRPPEFSTKSVAGAHKGKNASYPLEVVRSKWVDGATALYIGMSESSLQERIGDYMNGGRGQNNKHAGGRLIWHLQDHLGLLVRWKVISNERPNDVKDRMLEKFKLRYGQRPFANHRG